MSKYLIIKDDSIYSYINNSAVKIGNVPVENSHFDEYGSETLPNSDIMLSMGNFTLITNEQRSSFVANWNQLTYKTLVKQLSTIDVNKSHIVGIESITLDGDVDSIELIISLNGGLSWYNYTNDNWNIVDLNDPIGTPASQFNSLTVDLTSLWNLDSNLKKLKVGVIINCNSYDAAKLVKLNKIEIKYITQ